jgi:hypothetical protein
LLAVALCACERVQPIYNVQNHMMPISARALTSEQVTRIITEAAQSNGWSTVQIGPREMRATQKWRDHSASVIITHDDQSFSIRYDGATNLLRTSAGIHRAYNARVQVLEAAIERRLFQGY